MLRACGEHEPQWLAIVEAMRRAVAEDWPVQAYADSLGLQKGISGFIYHTVPVVSYAWYRHCGDFKATLTAVLDCVIGDRPRFSRREIAEAAESDRGKAALQAFRCVEDVLEANKNQYNLM